MTLNHGHLNQNLNHAESRGESAGAETKHLDRKPRDMPGRHDVSVGGRQASSRTDSGSPGVPSAQGLGCHLKDSGQ